MNREEELEQRLARLELRLLHSQRDLDAFLYAVSHDIRGPLRSILASAVILKEDYGDRLGRDGLAEIERQANSARKIATIVDTVLKLSRLGREEMHVAPLDLSEIATEVGREAAAKAGVDTEIEVDPALRAIGDPRHVRMFLGALFENALKFAPRGKTPRIHFGSRDGAFVLADNGIGFDPAQAERIFKPFEKLNGDDYPGVGIGLSMVRMIVARHGGEVWAEGCPGEGANFFFTLG